VGRQMRLRDLDTSLDQLEGLRPRFTSTRPSRFVATKVSRPAAITPTSAYGLLRFIQDTATLCSLPALCTGSRVRYRDPVSDTGVGLQRDSQEAFDHRVDLLGHL
jgi:hypothetical protein